MIYRFPSNAKLVANIMNANKSTGPRTEAGKAVVSQNARKHGFAAKSLYIPANLQPLFEQLTAELEAALQPEGLLEFDAFHQLRNARFNMERIQMLQTALATRSDELGIDPLLDSAVKGDWDRLEAYLVRNRSVYQKNLRQLQNLQTSRAQRQQLAEVLPKDTPALADPKPAYTLYRSLLPRPQRPAPTTHNAPPAALPNSMPNSIPNLSQMTMQHPSAC